MYSTVVEQLLFVYNAKSGLGNALLDSAHKIFSPGSYDCNLCAITFGAISENRNWKEFRQNSGLEMKFLHLDEFKERYPNENYNKHTFPQVFKSKKGKLEIFLSKEEINAMKNQEDLIQHIQEKYPQKTSE